MNTIWRFLLTVRLHAFVSAFLAGTAPLLNACVTTGELSGTEHAAAVHGRPFLYRLAKEGAKGEAKSSAPSFLFGTVHVSVDAHSELAESVWAAFHASRCYVMEADAGLIDQKWITAQSRAAAGNSLKAKMPKPAWEKLVKAVAPVMGVTRLDGVEPWFAALLYMQAHLPRSVDAMDDIFLQEARDAGKKIFFLEEWTTALLAIKRTTTVEDLVATVEEPDEEEKNGLETMLAAYRQGDEKKMERVLDDESRRGISSQSASASLKALLDDRNAAWLPKLEAHLTTGGCFVAVGAGHLFGARGLVQSLKNVGFSVQRPPPND